MKRLQAKAAAAELDALLATILDRAFIRLQLIPARREGEFRKGSSHTLTHCGKSERQPTVNKAGQRSVQR
jgi:hypothetical protein